MSAHLAVVVATYNRAGPLDHLLTCLEGQSLPAAEWEVWVADDGSEDATPQVLAAWQERGTIAVHSLRHTNAGQSVARDRAIRATAAPRIVVLDDDMEPGPDFLAAHRAAADADPARIVVIGRVVPEDGWRRKPPHEVVREAAMQELHSRLADPRVTPSANAFVTQNVGFPRALYLEVGGFDPKFRLDEDRELGLRLERHGGRFCFAAAAWAVHRSNVGSYAKWRRRQYEYGHYAVQLWEKHGHPIAWHPLRNLVTGSPWNRALVTLGARSDGAARLVTAGLRLAGMLAHRLHATGGVIAAFKAILALQYHLGVKHALGGWRALQRARREFLATSDHPTTPIGEGPTL